MEFKLLSIKSLVCSKKRKKKDDCMIVKSVKTNLNDGMFQFSSSTNTYNNRFSVRHTSSNSPLFALPLSLYYHLVRNLFCKKFCFDKFCEKFLVVLEIYILRY